MDIGEDAISDEKYKNFHLLISKLNRYDYASVKLKISH